MPPMALKEQWTDEEFLGYFELHSRTDLALFHRKHVERLLKMAGQKVPESLKEWTSVHDDVADPLIAQARGNIAVDHVHRL
jgi:hypothetical protein